MELRDQKNVPVDSLPLYFLNEDSLSLEAELRFQQRMDKMLRTLDQLLQVFKREHGGSIFIDVETFLRSRKAAALILLEDNPESEGCPGSRIYFASTKRIVTRLQVVQLQDNCRLEKALILLLCVYYILDFGYPNAFGQTLGLLKTVLLDGSPFEEELRTSRLTSLLNCFQTASAPGFLEYREKKENYS